MDDQTLVRGMLDGQELAFEEFFDSYFQRLYRFALRRLHDPDAAEDVAQATLIAAVRSIGTWRGEAALFTWLCTLCRRELSAHWRRSGRQPQMHSIDDDVDVRGRLDSLALELERPDAAIDRRHVAELVEIVLDNLPPRYGDVLEWKYIHGLTVAEIADRVQSTPKAVESLLTRAREAFREGFVEVSG